nr:hypothetical protein [Armatimonadota bacterium]
MNVLHRMCVVPLLVAAAALVGGCSGSGPSTPDTSVNAGKAVGGVAVSVKFAPQAATRVPGSTGVPIGAVAVKVRIVNSNNVDLAQPQIVAAPA